MSEHVPQLATSARYPQNKIVSQLLPLLLLHPSRPTKRAPAASPGTQLRLVDRGRYRVEGPRLVERQVALTPRPLLTAVSRMRPCACIVKGYGVDCMRIVLLLLRFQHIVLVRWSRLCFRLSKD